MACYLTLRMRVSPRLPLDPTARFMLSACDSEPFLFSVDAVDGFDAPWRRLIKWMAERSRPSLAFRPVNWSDEPSTMVTTRRTQVAVNQPHPFDRACRGSGQNVTASCGPFAASLF